MWKTALEWGLPVIPVALWLMPSDWVIGRFFRSNEPTMRLGISQAKQSGSKKNEV